MKRRFQLERFWLAGCMAVGAFLSFVKISSSSIWYDEGFTMMLSERSPARIWVDNIRDVHPPLHYLALHYWMKLFGTSEAAARSLSAVFMLAAVPVIYFLVKRLFSERSARWSALFVAIGPYMVRFAQEARMYAMVTFFLAAASFLLVRAVQDGRKLDWLGYSVLMALAFYTHYYTIFMVLVHWFYLLAVYPRAKKDRFNPLKLVFVSKAWFVSMVGTVVLFLPWLPNAVAQFSKVSAGFWIPTPPPDTVGRTLVQFLTFSNLDRPNAQTIRLGTMTLDPVTAGWRLAALLLLAAVIVWAVRRHRNQEPGLKLLAMWAILPPVLVFLISLKRAIYLDRYFTFAALAFYALLAVLLNLDWSKRLTVKFARVVLLGGLVVTMLWGVTNVYKQTNHRMREAVTEIRDNYTSGDLVVSPQLYTYFDSSYYLKRFGLPEQKIVRTDSHLDGYGVSSLIYTRLDEISVGKYEELERPASGNIWIIAQESEQRFFTDVPANWRADSPRYHHGRIMVQRFKVL